MVTDADRAMGIEWRLDVGSTIHAPPAIGSDGAVYVGTGDGYLVSIGAEGVLNWSYTLEGAVAWSPVIDTAGRVYVATTAQRLCAFWPNGGLAWQVRTPAHVASDLSLTAPSGVLFGDIDGNVWAYSEHGSALWHAELHAPIRAGPHSFGSRYVVATTTGEVVSFDGAQRKSALHIDERCEAIVAASPDGSLSVLAGATLVAFGAKWEARFRRGGVVSATANGDGYLTIDSDETLWQLGPDGGTLARVPLGQALGSAPVAAPSGAVYVGGAAGALAIVDRAGKVRWVPIAPHAALHRPVIDVAHHRVVVASGSGIVASLRLED
jgi:outer membrane protein assembly factor BamB